MRYCTSPLQAKKVVGKKKTKAPLEQEPRGAKLDGYVEFLPTLPKCLSTVFTTPLRATTTEYYPVFKGVSIHDKGSSSEPALENSS